MLYKCKICGMLFADNIALERSLRGCHCDCAFHIYTLLTYTNTRSVEAEKQLYSKTPTSARKYRPPAKFARMQDVDLEQTLSVWLMYVADNVKARVLKGI